MKTKTLLLLTVFLALVQSLHGQGTAFVYQGLLNENGIPANGANDFQFTLHSAASGNNPVGSPVTVDNLILSDGLFTATLNFGGSVFNGEARWLEIGVRPGTSAGPYTSLSPRQALTPAPYAVFAGGVNAAGIKGPITPNNLAPSIGLWSKSGAAVFYNGGNVGIGASTPGYPLAVAGGNHQIGLVDTDNAGKTWTLTTIQGNDGFGIYENGETPRLVVDSGGKVTIESGKAVVYNSSGTEVMIHKIVGIITLNGLAPNSGVDGVLTWGNLGFTAPPAIFAGDFQPGPNGLQSFAQILVTPHSATTTGCRLRIFNAGSTSASLNAGRYNCIVIGNR